MYIGTDFSKAFRSFSGLFANFRDRYWDRVSPHHPYLDPETVSQSRHREETARNTGRILSGFERVERISSFRAPPKCSACGGLGHTRSQRQCPLNLRSSIANDIVRLQEQERSLPMTPQASKRIRTEVPESTQSSVTEFFSPLSTLSFRISPKSSENSFITPQATTNLTLNIPLAPEVVFRNPYDIINSARSPSSSPSTSPSPSPPIRLARLEEPPKPLHHERIEIAYLRYQQEKEKWLEDHPTIKPSEYRKIRGFNILTAKVIQECQRFLPEERRKPSGELIERKTEWLEEEIFAWNQYQKKLEDDMFNKTLQDWEINGFQQYEGLNNVMERIGNEIEAEKEHYIM
jgi:hypothetical protein